MGGGGRDAGLPPAGNCPWHLGAADKHWGEAATSGMALTFRPSGPIHQRPCLIMFRATSLSKRSKAGLLSKDNKDRYSAVATAGDEVHLPPTEAGDWLTTTAQRPGGGEGVPVTRPPWCADWHIGEKQTSQPFRTGSSSARCSKVPTDVRPCPPRGGGQSESVPECLHLPDPLGETYVPKDREGFVTAGSLKYCAERVLSPGLGCNRLSSRGSVGHFKELGHPRTWP